MTRTTAIVLGIPLFASFLGFTPWATAAPAAAHVARPALVTPEMATLERAQRNDDARRRAQEEARRRAQEEARRRAQEEARRRAQEEARRRAQEEARRRAQEEARRRAQEEARRRAQEEARRRAQEEARRRAQEEARQRAQEEARRRAQEEARRRAQEEARRRAQEEARQRAQEEARRRAQEEARQRAQEEARRRAQDDARQRAQEEARRRAQDDARQRELTDLRQRALARQRAEEEARRRAQEEARQRRPASTGSSTVDRPRPLPTPAAPNAVPSSPRPSESVNRPAPPLTERPDGQAWMEAPQRTPRVVIRPGSAPGEVERAPRSGTSQLPTGVGTGFAAAPGFGASGERQRVAGLLPPPPAQPPLPGDPPAPAAPLVVPPAPIIGEPTIIEINQPVYNFNTYTWTYNNPVICPDVIVLPRRRGFRWHYGFAFGHRSWWHDPWCDPYYGWAWTGHRWRARFVFSIGVGFSSINYGYVDPFWRPFRTWAIHDPWCRPVAWRPVRFHRIAYRPYSSHRSLWVCDDWYGVRSWYAPSTYRLTSWSRAPIASLAPPIAPLAPITIETPPLPNVDEGWSLLRDGDIVAAHDVFRAIYMNETWNLEAGFGLVVTTWFWNDDDVAASLLNDILLDDPGIVDRIPDDPFIHYQFRRLIETLQTRALTTAGDDRAQLTIAALEAAMGESLRAYYFSDQVVPESRFFAAAHTLKQHMAARLSM